MEFLIKIHKSEYGYDISCPTLKGCHSQGETKEDAVENIKTSIQECLEVLSKENKDEKLERIEVAI